MSIVIPHETGFKFIPGKFILEWNNPGCKMQSPEIVQRERAEFFRLLKYAPSDFTTKCKQMPCHYIPDPDRPDAKKNFIFMVRVMMCKWPGTFSLHVSFTDNYITDFDEIRSVFAGHNITSTQITNVNGDQLIAFKKNL